MSPVNVTREVYATPYHLTGSALTLKLDGARMLAARFYSADKPMIREARRLVKDQGQFTKELVQFFSPVDTTFMQQHVGVWYTRDGLAFSVGWDAAEFIAAGLEFYPPFQEYGTSKMHAQPSLGPGYREGAKSFEDATRDWYRRALERNLRGRA